MAIIFKPKTRVKKLQYGGSVPVYSDFDYTDAKQAVYNPMSLLKKYGADSSKPAATKAASPSLPKDSSVGLDNDNTDFYNTYNKLKGMYESGMNSSEYYGSTNEGKQVKSALDRHTTLGVQAKKNREKLYGESVAKVNSAETGGNWMFSGGVGMMRKFDEETGRVEYKKRVPIKDISELEEDGWSKMVVSDFMDASANDPNFAGDTKLLNTVKNIVSQADVLTALDAAFSDIGKQAESHSNKYGNVDGGIAGAQFSGTNLKNYLQSSSKTSNKKGLGAALENINRNLSPAQKDAIKSIVVTNGARTAAEVKKGVTDYIALEMLKRVDKNTANEFELTLDEKEEEDENASKGVGHLISSGKFGQYTKDLSGSDIQEDHSTEMVQYDKEGNVIGKTITINYTGSKMPNVSAGVMEDAEKGKAGIKQGISGRLYDIGSAVVANAPHIKLEDVKVGIEKGTEYDKVGFLDAAVYSNKPHHIHSVPTYKNKILSFTPKELADYAVKLEEKRQSYFLLKGDKNNYTEDQAADWKAKKDQFTNIYFKSKTEGNPQGLVMAPAVTTYMAMETDALLDSEHSTHKSLKYYAADPNKSSINSNTVNNFIQHNPDGFTTEGGKQVKTNPELDTKSDKYSEIAVTMLATPLSNSIYADGKQQELGVDKFNAEDVNNIWNAKLKNVSLADYLSKMIDTTKTK